MHRFSTLTLFAVLASNLGGVLGAATLRNKFESRQEDLGLLKDFRGQPPLPKIAAIQAANASDGSFLQLDNIQGDILVGMKKPAEHFYFFQITDATAFKAMLRKDVVPLITSVETLVSPPVEQPPAYVNIAFSQSGLTALGVTDSLGDPNFAKGQFADAANLKDDTSTWASQFKGTSIHGVILIGSDANVNIENTFASLKDTFLASATVVLSLDGAARPGSEAGHEHFGYLDGISQPAVDGFTTNALAGQSVVPAGVILTGRDGDALLASRPAWALDGSFLAFRKLKQLVPEYKKFLLDNAVQNDDNSLTTQQGADLLGARLIGRWPSGAPVDLAPTADDAALGADATRNNNFDFSHTGSDITSDQSQCPFTAHIRKTRPRADLGNGDLHQAIRAGIPYGPEVTDAEAASGTTSVDRGLAFVMYQSVIANGFQFQQVAWANNANFIFGKNISAPGLDPIIGQAGGGAARTFTGSDPKNFTRSFTEGQTVISNGGEYFFVPSISALNTTLSA